MEYNESQQNLITELRKLDYAKVRIKIMDGLPIDANIFNKLPRDESLVSRDTITIAEQALLAAIKETHFGQITVIVRRGQCSLFGTDEDETWEHVRFAA